MAIDQRIEQKAVETAGVDRTRDPNKGRAAAEFYKQERARLGTDRFMDELSKGRAQPLTESKRLKLADRSTEAAGASRNRIEVKLEEYSLLAKDGGFDSFDPAIKGEYRGTALAALGPNFSDVISGPPPMTKPEKDAFAESFLKEGLFVTELNARLHSIDRRKFDPSGKDIDRRKDQLVASGKPDDAATRKEAYEQLQNEFQLELQQDIDGAASYAVQQVLKTTYEASRIAVHDRADELDERAKELANEAGKWAGDGIAEQLRRRWDAQGAFDKRSNLMRGLGAMGMATVRPDGIGLRDYDAFARDGLNEDFLNRCGIDPADINDIMNNPDLRKEYENVIGQDLLLRKLGSGTLSKEDMRKLEHAPWMGNTPQERVDTIRQMFERRQDFRDLENAGRAGGMLDSNFWNNVRDAAARGALPGGTIGLLATLLGLPFGPLGLALGAAGGAYLRRIYATNQSQKRFDLAA